MTVWIRTYRLREKLDILQASPGPRALGDMSREEWQQRFQRRILGQEMGLKSSRKDFDDMVSKRLVGTAKLHMSELKALARHVFRDVTLVKGEDEAVRLLLDDVSPALFAEELLRCGWAADAVDSHLDLSSRDRLLAVFKSLSPNEEGLALEDGDVSDDCASWQRRALQRLPRRELPRIGNESTRRLRFGVDGTQNVVTLLEIGPADNDFGYLVRCVTVANLRALQMRSVRGGTVVVLPPANEPPFVISGTVGEYDLLAILSCNMLPADPPSGDDPPRPMSMRQLRELLAAMRRFNRERTESFAIRRLSFRLV